jgi:NADH-quinone oxidoreductase subunit E
MAPEVLESITREFAGSRGDLIPVLQRVQAVREYLPPQDIRRIARWIRVSEHEIYGVATFYSQFRFHPPGRHRLKVCLGTACHVGGGESFLDIVHRSRGIAPGQTTPDGDLSVERVACLGCCALAPVVVLDEGVHGRLTRFEFQGILDSLDGP